MKEVNKTVYICDHCGKKLFMKHAMIKHENFCFKNPVNVTACVGCTHCEEIPKLYMVEGDDGYQEQRRTKGFKCNKLNKLMYPYHVVKRDILKKHPEMFKNEVQMPSECEHWDFA